MTFVLSYLALVLVVAMVSCAPVVKLSHSTFLGVDLEAHETKKPYHVYYAIPFAEPPVGKLRFQAPVAYDNTRQRTFNETTNKPGCVQQPSFFGVLPSVEDCLYLNVFIPSVGENGTFDVNPLKKVIVYIHGGSFLSGIIGHIHPSNMVTDYDVILVAPAYRLGVLGFLSSGDEALPGNFGLLDQITALQWVKDNIRSFGGDPNDVTIYGASAGGVSASLLSMSPKAKGLFTKVIMESGSALAPWAIDKRSKDTFFLLAERTKCIPTEAAARTSPREYHSKIVNCLRDVDAHELERLLAFDQTISSEDALSMESYAFFVPVVDGVLIPRDPFELVKDADYLKSVGALDRKYLVTVSNKEGMMFMEMAKRRVSQDILLNPDSPVTQAIIENNFRSVHASPITKEILHIISFMYYYPRNLNGSSSMQITADFIGDVDFVVPAIKFVRALTKASKDVTVYLTLLDYYPPLKNPGNLLQGSAHGLTTALLFNGDHRLLDLWMPYADFPPESVKSLTKILREMMTNMAKKGNASYSESVDCPAYDLENESYIAISETPEVRRHMYSKRMALWDDLLPNVLGSESIRETRKPPKSEL